MSKSMLTRDLPSYRRQGSGKRLVRNALAVAVLVFLFFTVIGGLLLRGYRIQSDTMAPGVTPGSYLLVTPLLFGKESWFSGGTWMDFATPRRGDLVMLVPPWRADGNFFGRFASHVVGFFTLGRVHPRYAGEGQKSWEVSLVARRVIAVPGDQVYMEGGVFYVKSKGQVKFRHECEAAGKRYELKAAAVPLRDARQFFSTEMAPRLLGQDEYFVAADNRSAGLDSRDWGPVGAADLRGLVLARYWPANRFAWLP
jgi:signal peptidase I